MMKITLRSFLFICTLLSLEFLYAEHTVGGRVYSVDTITSVQVGPSSYFSRYSFKHSSAPLLISLLKVDLNDPFVNISTVMSADSISGNERPSAMAKRKSKSGALYFGGTNGDFYATTGAVGTPINGQIVERQITRLPHSSRPLIAFDSAKNPLLGIFKFRGVARTSSGEYTISKTNDSRGNNELVLFNSYNGKNSRTNSFGTEVKVELIDSDWAINSDTRVRVVAIEKGIGNMQIGSNYAVLSGHGDAAAFLNNLSTGDEITLQLSIDTEQGASSFDFAEMIGGDRLILADGEITDNDWAENHPRTAIGFSQDKRFLYFMVVDGRSSLSVGCTTKQLGELIKLSGASDALNLDGGGSSALYVNKLGVTNNPSDYSERAVANGIFAVSTAPEDEFITNISTKEYKFSIPIYGVIKPTFYGYNKYGVLIDSDLKGVTLSCSDEYGYITEENSFVATSSLDGTIQATFQGITIDIPYKVDGQADISLRLDSVVLDSKLDYTIEVIGKVGDNTIPMHPNALTWSIRNAQICEIYQGTIKPISNGETWVVGELGEFIDSIKVKVQMPQERYYSQYQFEDLNTWSYTASSNLKDIEFLTHNRPSHWECGSTVNYRYTSGRAPSIRLSKEITLYSLPDTMRLTLNTGEVDLSKIILSIRASNTSIATSFTFENLKKGIDNTISLSSTQMGVDRSDLAGYPIKLEYLMLYINTTSQVVDQIYSIGLKEITMVYDNIELSTSSPSLSSQIKVYPNPSNIGRVTVDLDREVTSKASVTLITLSGEIIRSYNLSSNFTDRVEIPLNGVNPGTYFIRVAYDEYSEVAKLIVR
ncbi:MAG: phosphodiester glycosidase family protein [Bacteroidales bacterium]